MSPGAMLACGICSSSGGLGAFTSHIVAQGQSACTLGSVRAGGCLHRGATAPPVLPKVGQRARLTGLRTRARAAAPMETAALLARLAWCLDGLAVEVARGGAKGTLLRTQTSARHDLTHNRREVGGGERRRGVEGRGGSK